AVVAHFPQAASAGLKPLEGGLVHRLDNGTSGATMIALSAAAFARMRSALRSQTILRSYVALVPGKLERPLQLDFPIAHHPHNRRTMPAVTDPRLAAGLRARPPLTIVNPRRPVDGFTLVDVPPRGGCRHQIRVHLAAADLPLAGDQLYGGPAMAALAPGRFFLHLPRVRIPRAAQIRAPGNGRAEERDSAIVVEAAMPADLQASLAALGAAHN